MNTGRYLTRLLLLTVAAALLLPVSISPLSCSGGGKSLLEPVRPTIITALPHDTTAFTQGFVYHREMLYESTGLVGQSRLRSIDPSSGAVTREVAIPDLFAEGMVVHDNRFVILTWRDEAVLYYTFPDMVPAHTGGYQGEGWGLTLHNDLFVMSNGSDTLFFRDHSFRIVRTLPVRHRSAPLYRLNELEYARGLIYANVWYNDFIFAIDPATGKVVQIVDCSELVAAAGRTIDGEVLNGIAWDPSTDRFFITGKNWPYLFVVLIPPVR